MKKIICIITVIMALSLTAHGQSPSFYEFYDKYAGLDGYTTVEMSGAMFKAMNASSKKESSGSSALSDIKNMVIVISERPGKAFKDDIKKLTRSGEYQSMSVIRDGKDVVEFYVVTQNDKVKEFLMIVMDSSDCVVMAITGDDLSVKGISQIASQAAGVEGIELEEF